MSINKKRSRVTVACAAVVVVTLINFIFGIDYNRIIFPPHKRAPTGTHLKARTKDVFSMIYQNNFWGKGHSSTPFYSGTGSHDADTVDPYVAAVRSFLSTTFTKPPVTADLGCGDFNVGRQIRNVTSRYIACDIVPEMIAYNKVAYVDQDVDFRVLDIISEDLPPADVVLIRQVLQHLDNKRIAYIVPKLYRYRWAIITEHLPFQDDFVPNLDIPMGTVRLVVNSGLDLTEAPFELHHYGAFVLSETLAIDGRIRTTAYLLKES